MSRAKGYFKTNFPIHPVSRQCIAIFLPERECIGNYTPNSRLVLTVYKFNTLPLYKKKLIGELAMVEHTDDTSKAHPILFIPMPFIR